MRLTSLSPSRPSSILAILGLLSCLLQPAMAQGDAEKVAAEAQALLDEQLHAPGAPRAKLLIVGTFHFNDQGLDEFKPQHRLDVFADERQLEIEDIVARLQDFEPTHVCVERRRSRQAQLDKTYASYLTGEGEPNPNEIHQIGFRLAENMGHEKVYAVDAPGRWLEPRANAEEAAARLGQSERMATPYFARMTGLAEHMDELKTRQSIRQQFLWLNSEPFLNANMGLYLIGGFSVGAGDEYPGVDGFTSQWFNRNLRILANLAQLVEGNDERILLLIGAGHVPILRFAAKASPEFELLDVNEYLSDAEDGGEKR